MRHPDAGLPALPRILFVTGTDTGVGKTMTTAALAAALSAGSRAASARNVRPSVAVYKPVQTGVREEEAGDIEEVRRLAGIDDVLEGARLRLPMAPIAAAAREGASLPGHVEHTETIRSLAGGFDHVLVEGVGGLLVELEPGFCLADLAADFIDGTKTAGTGGDSRQTAGIVVVCRSGLGTLNHTLLTLEALQRRSLPVSGLVIGAWPQEPTDIELDNQRYLSDLPVPFLGRVPMEASALHPPEFRAQASEWFRGGRH
ncbi:dethiobiotin synthase [Arthrobacter sulfonylureivorans]|uniref:ATP-dependent dethiobiotin synthetase BioD n=1 Tax=Arthrobacter sulfonylureivorans TaxID=2486855 RepID=A0ABY3WBG3_9MICC|nr:dethiobiotin synthase [Arthrobacter sulfonylureivorans]UNK45647.1 dethiobiotin synthase [Arthrobacter sulfonylureivorans]